MLKSLLWLWRQAAGYRWRILLSGLLGLMNVACSLFFVYLSKMLIDVATHQQEGGVRMLYVLAASLMLLLVVEAAFSIGNGFMSGQSNVLLTNKLRSDLFHHILTSRWNGKEKLHSGDVINRLSEDVYDATSAVCSTMPSTIVTFVQLVAAFVFLFCLNPMLAIVTLVVTPIFLLLSKLYVKKVRQMTKDIRTTDSKVKSVLQENIQHRVLIQSMEQGSNASSLLKSWQNSYYRKVMRRVRFSIYSASTVSIGFSAGYLIAFLWGAVQLYEGTITFGVMTAFLQLVSRIQNPVYDLSKQLPEFVRVSTSVDRLSELEAMPAEEEGEALQLPGVAGLELKHVTFRYPDGDKDVLSDFSYTFRPGSHVAIMGETGTGKSTLIRLLLSILHPQQGQITLYTEQDGKRVEQPVSARTRVNYIYVPQGNTLLSGSIRENLLMGNPNATDEQLREVLHTAVADFVWNLPDGIDTLCGERGTGLSEGQAQRLAIARGLLRPGSVLLLDELSSSLDIETESILLQRLTAQQKGKTMIFITHREVVKDYCDEVLAM